MGTSAEIAEKLIDRGIFDIYYDIMNFGEPKMLIMSLESVEKILIHGENTPDLNGCNILLEKVQSSKIPKYLQELQLNPEQKIFDLAGYIIEKYFESELITNDYKP